MATALPSFLQVPGVGLLTRPSPPLPTASGPSRCSPQSPAKTPVHGQSDCVGVSEVENWSRSEIPHHGSSALAVSHASPQPEGCTATCLWGASSGLPHWAPGSCRCPHSPAPSVAQQSPQIAGLTGAHCYSDNSHSVSLRPQGIGCCLNPHTVAHGECAPQKSLFLGDQR